MGRRRLLNSSIRVLHFLYLQDKIKVTVNARPTLLIVSSTPRQDDVGCRSSMFLLETLNFCPLSRPNSCFREPFSCGESGVAVPADLKKAHPRSSSVARS